MAAKPIEINIVGSYNDKDVKRAMRDLEKLSTVSAASGNSIGQQFANLAGGMEKAGKNLTAAVTLPVAGLAAASVAAFMDQETAVAKMESVIKSTGGVAGVTSQHVQDLAGSLQQTTVFADETTVGAAALALTFKNLRNEAGAGNDIFDRTIKASQDMATVMGTDLNSATMMISKALNEPAEGLSKLSRAGVQFTAEQETMIRTLAASGDTMGAQKVMLAELESQFGGAAKAVGETTEGRFKIAMNNLDDSAESIGKIIIPVLEEIVRWVSRFADWIKKLSPDQQKLVVMIAGVAAAIGPTLLIGAKLIKTVQGVSAAFTALGANPVVLVIVAVVVAIAALVAGLIYAYHHFEGFRNVVDTVADTIRKVALYIWDKGLKPAFAELTKTFRTVIIPIVQQLVAKFQEAWPKIQAALAKAWTFMQPILRTIGEWILKFLVGYIRFAAHFWSIAIKVIAKIVTWLWSNVLGPVFRFIGAVIVNVVIPYVQRLWQVWSVIFAAIAKVASWIWNSILKPVFGFIADVIVNYVVPYVQRLWQVWSAIFAAIAKVVSWVWNSILKPVFDFIGQVITGIIIPIFVTFGAIFGAIWNAIATAATWVWENVLSPIFDFIGQVITGIIVPILVTLGAIFALIWKGIAAAATWAWETIIKPIWDAIVAFINVAIMPVLNVLGDVFSAVWDGIVNAVQWAWGILSNVFNSIKNAFGDVANFFSDKVGQIVGFFSGIADAIGGAFADAFEAIKRWWNEHLGGKGFKMPDVLGGAEFRIPTLAKGGIVPGLTGTPVLAMLHAGERVLRRQEQSPTPSRADGAVNVYVNRSDADPYEIGREILWTLKVAG